MNKEKIKNLSQTKDYSTYAIGQIFNNKTNNRN